VPTDERIEAFQHWLRTHATPAQAASFNRSVFEGILALAGAARVQAEHVDRGQNGPRYHGTRVSFFRLTLPRRWC